MWIPAYSTGRYEACRDSRGFQTPSQSRVRSIELEFLRREFARFVLPSIGSVGWCHKMRTQHDNWNLLKMKVLHFILLTALYSLISASNLRGDHRNLVSGCLCCRVVESARSRNDFPVPMDSFEQVSRKQLFMPFSFLLDSRTSKRPSDSWSYRWLAAVVLWCKCRRGLVFSRPCGDKLANCITKWKVQVQGDWILSRGCRVFWIKSHSHVQRESSRNLLLLRPRTKLPRDRSQGQRNQSMRLHNSIRLAK